MHDQLTFFARPPRAYRETPTRSNTDSLKIRHCVGSWFAWKSLRFRAFKKSHRPYAFGASRRYANEMTLSAEPYPPYGQHFKCVTMRPSFLSNRLGFEARARTWVVPRVANLKSYRMNAISSRKSFAKFVTECVVEVHCLSIPDIVCAISPRLPAFSCETPSTGRDNLITRSK